MNTMTRQVPFAQILLALAALALLAGFIPAQQANVLPQYAIAIVLGAAAIVWLFRSRARLDRFNAKSTSGFGMASCVLATVAGLAMVGSTVASAV